jgi:hypothetical protein
MVFLDISRHIEGDCLKIDHGHLILNPYRITIRDNFPISFDILQLK